MKRLNALICDTDTMMITLPVSATGAFMAEIETDAETAVFRVYDGSDIIIEKNGKIVPYDDKKYVSFEIDSADTRGRDAGEYVWTVVYGDDEITGDFILKEAIRIV